MVLKDDYGKIMILLDEENLIYKRNFINITIKKDEIRSVFCDEVILGRKHIYKYKKYEIDKIKLIRSNYINIIEFKKNGNKYVMYFKENPYLIKIYNLSLSKIFS